MHSSTSNFDRPLPVVPWLRIFATALFIFFSIAIAIEVNLAHLGYRPTVADTIESWIAQRVRAKNLGKQGLIWIGASRGQLGIDLNALRDKTGLEPVQLAIDGSSFFPVLKDLADDPEITGAVIIDYQPDSVYVVKTEDFGAATVWERRYEKEKLTAKSPISLQHTEKALSEYLHEHLSAYSGDADPLLSLQFRILPQDAPAQFLVTYPDRSRAADYRSSDPTGIYYLRAARNMGVSDVTGSNKDIEQRLRAKLATLQSRDPAVFLQGVEYVKQQIDKIEARGGKVILVEMPTSGLVKEADDKFYPRAQFLEVFERVTGKTVLVSNETPKLKDFICPDGSHLDMRDRTQFTNEMVDALGLSKPSK